MYTNNEGKNIQDAISYKKGEFTHSAEDAVIAKVVRSFNPKDCIAGKPCICCPAFVKCNGID